MRERVSQRCILHVMHLCTHPDTQTPTQMGIYTPIYTQPGTHTLRHPHIWAYTYPYTHNQALRTQTPTHTGIYIFTPSLWAHKVRGGGGRHFFHLITHTHTNTHTHTHIDTQSADLSLSLYLHTHIDTPSKPSLYTHIDKLYPL